MSLREDDVRQSLKRAPLLSAARDRAVDRSTLTDELDISRATAYRWTSALADDDLLERTRNGYRTTPAGAAVSDAADRFERTLSAIDRLRPLLEHVSAPEFTRNVDRFADATLAVATPQNPNEPLELWLDHFSSFDSSRGMIVAGCPPEITRLGIEHVESGADFEVICTPQAFAADQSGDSESANAIVTAASTSLYTHPEVPFSMAIVDETVLVVGFDAETSLPVAAAATDDADAREWAEDLYRRYKREGEPLNALDASPVA